MAQFAIIFKPEAVMNDMLIVEADYYIINWGFFSFCKEGGYEVCSHSCDEISSVTIQKEYTDEEVLEQLEKYKKEGRM